MLIAGYVQNLGNQDKGVPVQNAILYLSKKDEEQMTMYVLNVSGKVQALKK